MLPLSLRGARDVVLLAAHCDDLAIGAGGTIAALCRDASVRVRALVLTGGGTEREVEERAALAELCGPSSLAVSVCDLPDGRIPARWLDAKAAVATCAKAGPADVVIAPHPGDHHQDHRAVAEMAWQEFRDHLVLGYEIAKYESDLPAVNAYVGLSERQMESKLSLLERHYASQRDHDWYEREAFAGLARLRGVQCHRRYAEGFVASKVVIDC